MSRKTIRQKIDATLTVLVGLEKEGLVQKDFLQDLNSEIAENYDRVIFLEETLKSCADTNKKTREEEELSRVLFQLSQDAGAAVDAVIIEDWNALKDSQIKTLETRRSREEIFRELLEKCFQGEDMFSDKTLKWNIDDLSKDIDDLQRVVTSRQELCRDRKATLEEYSDQDGDISLLLRNELRDLDERSTELKKSLLAKEEENSEADKELKEFAQ